MEKSKIQLAQLIADTVEKILESRNISHENMSLGAYQNGREQGFSICCYNGSLKFNYTCFSENRNSDQIVIYYSDTIPNHSITDEMYKNAKYFSRTFVIEAAEYIIDCLLKE